VILKKQRLFYPQADEKQAGVSKNRQSVFQGLWVF